ncbi:uncharacterized protein LOC121290744 isoform X3 [Carcharodon carcharias]|uniref:uncharacterized protein LOC121290744 isoform X3 n=1 Tax=Carcharodon carcharias TaxID=13397 RepID=UPI001B7DE693|nr:uncharacterized protein LOC121290744 isoform X3 [Carcharodon carcharias]
MILSAYCRSGSVTELRITELGIQWVRYDPHLSKDEIAKCHIGIWGLLGICILALMTSLVVNVIYCTANRQKAPRAIYQSVKQLQSPVIQEVDDNPIYGNLNQDTTGEDESCYEAMTPTNRYGDETKVTQSWVGG